jgi:hypothetical protein
MSLFVNRLQNRLQSQTGSALLGAVVLSIILTFMVLGYLQVAVSISNNESAALNDAKAFYAAEAGMYLGLEWLNVPSNYSQTTNLGNGASIDSVVHNFSLNGFSAHVDIIKAGANVTIRSTVASRSVLGYDKVISQNAVSITSSNITPFKYAGFGKNTVSMTGNGTTDSYNSANGAYGGANVAANGNVGTNGTTVGAIALGGNATINGNTNTGAGGTVTLGGNAAVTGTTSHNCAENFGSVIVPASLTSLASSGALGGGATVNAGNYKYTSSSLAGNSTVTINGNVSMYITGNFSTTGNAKMVVSAGASLKLYIAGTATLAGNGIVNNTAKPANFVLYSTYTGTDGIKITGNGALYGGIYAPDTDIKITGNGENYGALIAKSFIVTGNGGIHYDTELQNVSVNTTNAGGCTLIAGTWTETNAP